MKFFSWASGLISDQKGNASRKAAAMYILLGMFYMLEKGSLEGKVINEYILYAIVVLLLFCLGAISAEFFKDKFSKP